MNNQETNTMATPKTMAELIKLAGIQIQPKAEAIPKAKTLEPTKCLGCHSQFTPQPSRDEWFYGNGKFCSPACAGNAWARYAGVPIEFIKTNPEHLEPERLARVRAWWKTHLVYDPDPTSFGLLLHGEHSGTGKTRTATLAQMAICGARWEGEKVESKNRFDDPQFSGTGLWLSAGQFRSRYLASLESFEERKKFQRKLFLRDVLLLDDVDKLKPSEGLVELLHTVMDERFSNRRITILTCNSSGRKLERKWGEEYGPYMVRRLRDYCLTINFDDQTNP